MTTITDKLTRPIMRYHGSKWRIAPWVIEHFPPHKIYVEPFGGGGSVLLRKNRAVTEIYNDLDDEVVNLFRVLRDPDQSIKLTRLLSLTPFSRAEYNEAYGLTECAIETARRTLVKAWFGTHTKGLMHKSGFDTRINPDGFCSRVGTFIRLPGLMASYVDRMTGVVIENTDAIALIQRADRADSLFYVDPPYIPEARSGKYYRHEMTAEAHRGLSGVLHRCEGMVILSGYACDLYDRELYADWNRQEIPARTDGGHARTECLWINPAAWEKLQEQRYPLFGGAA